MDAVESTLNNQSATKLKDSSVSFIGQGGREDAG